MRPLISKGTEEAAITAATAAGASPGTEGNTAKLSVVGRCRRRLRV